MGKIVIGLETQSSAFTKGAKQVQSDLDGIGHSAKKNAEQVGGLRAQLDKLKGEAGRGSTLDELGKTLKGAGAVAGIAIIGEALEGVTKKAVELSEQFRKGQIDATGIAVKLGESIPVLGKFIEAGQNIRELFTHEQEQINQINESIKLGDTLMEDRVKHQHDSIKAQQDLNEELRKSEEQLKLARALSDDDKRKVEETNGIADKTAEQKKALDELTAAKKEAYDQDIANIKKAGEAEHKRQMDKIWAEADWKVKMETNGSFNDDDEKGFTERAHKALDAKISAAKQSAAAQEDIQIKAAKERYDKEIFIATDSQNKILNNLREKYAAEDVNKVIVDKLKEGETAAKSFFDKIAKFGEEVNKAGDKAKKEAFEKEQKQAEEIKAQLDDLKKEAAQFGMTEQQKKLDNLKADHADDATIAQAKALQDQIDKMQKWKDEQRAANDLIKESMTPLDKYQEELKKINKLYDDGLISQKQAEDAIKKAIKEDKADDDKGDDKAVAAQTRRFDFRGPAVAPEKEDKAAQQLQAALQQLEFNKQMAFCLQQLYQFGLNDQTDNSDPTIDFS